MQGYQGYQGFQGNDAEGLQGFQGLEGGGATGFQGYWEAERTGGTSLNQGYGGFNTSNASIASAATQHRIYYSPIYIPFDRELNEMICKVTTSASGATVRMGLYDSGSDGLPDVRIIDAGTVSAASTGVKSITGLSTTLGGGLFWIAVQVSETGAFLQFSESVGIHEGPAGTARSDPAISFAGVRNSAGSSGAFSDPAAAADTSMTATPIVLLVFATL